MTDLKLLETLTQPSNTKIVMLVLDGLGGLPKEPGGPTELEAARTPNMDKLAREGMLGLINTVDIGISPGSGPGHLGLFGYDPLKYVIGRGVLEAVGIGINLGPNDVAAHGNFCTVDGDGNITDRRAGRISTEECARMVGLIKDITIPGVEITVEPVRDYRFVLILRSPGLSHALNETDPQKVGVKPLTVEAQDGSKEADFTATVVNQWIEEVRKRIKDQHPANMATFQRLVKGARTTEFRHYLQAKGGGSSCVSHVQRSGKPGWYDSGQRATESRRSVVRFGTGMEQLRFLFRPLQVHGQPGRRRGF